MNRNDVTERIVTTRIQKGLSWASVADSLQLSKEWTTAACLGQMAFLHDSHDVGRHPCEQFHQIEMQLFITCLLCDSSS